MAQASSKTVAALKRQAQTQTARAEVLEADVRIAKAKAIKRAIAKAASSVGGGMRAYGNYDNATRTRLRKGTRARGGSAQYHLDANTQDAIRRDCRDLKRNNSVGRALLKRFKDMLVGDGAVVTSTTSNPKWNQKADTLFNDWADGRKRRTLGHPDVRGRHNLWQMCRAIAGAWMTDGDSLVILTSTGQVQLVESERIRNPQGRRDDETLVSGVVIDPHGRPIGFHVAEWNIYGGTNFTTQVVPAADAFLMCNPIDDDIGLIRGEPALAAAVDRIEQIDNYIEKTGVAAEIATLFGLWIESDRPGELQSMFEAGTEQPARDRAQSPREVELAAGEIMFGRPGEKAQQIKPEFPTTTFREYVTGQLQLIGSDIGLPVSVTFFDTAGLSWGNMKAQCAIAFRGLHTPQMVLANDFVAEVRNRKIEQWIAEGLLEENDEREECQIVFPPAPVFDFKSEVDAFGVAVEKNLMTHDQATQALGMGRGADVVNARAVEMADQRSKGVAPTITPGSMPAQPAPVDKPAEPDAKPEPEAELDDEIAKPASTN